MTVAAALTARFDLAVPAQRAENTNSKNQKLINTKERGDKGLTADAVIPAATANYKKATGDDLGALSAAGTLQGELLTAEIAAVAEVMNDAQAQINERGVGFKAFLPAIFARLVKACSKRPWAAVVSNYNSENRSCSHCYVTSP